MESAPKNRQLSQNAVHIRRKFGYAESEKRLNHRVVELTYLREGDSFGKSTIRSRKCCLLWQLQMPKSRDEPLGLLCGERVELQNRTTCLNTTLHSDHNAYFSYLLQRQKSCRWKGRMTPYQQPCHSRLKNGYQDIHLQSSSRRTEMCSSQFGHQQITYSNN